MKIRTGFVSNSSSSSFCIFGINIEEYCFSYDLLTEEAISYIKENCKEDIGEDEEDLCYNDNITEIIYGLGNHFGIESWTNYGYYIGNSWSNVQDDQTGREFKEEVKKNLSKIFKSDSKIWESLGTHEEAWH